MILQIKNNTINTNTLS